MQARFAQTFPSLQAWLPEHPAYGEATRQARAIPLNFEAAKMGEPTTTESSNTIDVDAQRMFAIAAGDEGALRELIERWQNPLINFFYRSTGSFEISEDLAQTTFIRIYRAAPRYEANAKFATYLFHIARRLLINEYRRQTRKPLESMDPADIQASVSGREKLNLMEIEEVLQAAMDDLPENQRTALLLLKQQELSYEEIAEAMGASLTAVKTWIHRGRQKLKERLQQLL